MPEKINERGKPAAPLIENSPKKPGLFSMRLALHHGEGFEHCNLGTTQQNGAAPGHLDCRIQRISLDNGVSTGHRPHRAITDGSVTGDAFGQRGKRIAAVYQGHQGLHPELQAPIVLAPPGSGQSRQQA